MRRALAERGQGMNTPCACVHVYTRWCSTHTHSHADAAKDTGTTDMLGTLCDIATHAHTHAHMPSS
eukprot:1148735-Alexandrium_andersonii.AAC.1